MPISIEFLGSELIPINKSLLRTMIEAHESGGQARGLGYLVINSNFTSTCPILLRKEQDQSNIQ